MQQADSAETSQRQNHLILVGGGHTHALFLDKLTKHPIADLNITLISPDQLTPYSGMLPGLIAGHYSYEDIHIDLKRLANKVGISFIQDKAAALLPNNNQLTLASGQTLSYDLISFDTGSTPTPFLDETIVNPQENKATETICPVKPISQFYDSWKNLALSNQTSSQDKTISVVGSGAAGVELALSFSHYLKQQNQAFNIQLITKSQEVLSGYPKKLRQKAHQRLLKAGINLILNFDVSKIEDNKLFTSDGRKVGSHYTVLCTPANGANWLRDTQLDLSERGFIRVRSTLQTLNYDNIFAVGDVSHFDPQPLPKAGVYAVRMAETLDSNIRALQAKTQLTHYQPQHDFLSLLACGEKYAIGCKFGLTISGKWVWKLKDRIDRSFMSKFSQ